MYLLQKPVLKSKDNPRIILSAQVSKTQLKGNLMLGLEGTYGRMNKLAKDEIYQGTHVTLQKIVKEIDRITPDQIRQLSHKLLDQEAFVVTALGPIPRKMVAKWG